MPRNIDWAILSETFFLRTNLVSVNSVLGSVLTGIGLVMRRPHVVRPFHVLNVSLRSTASPPGVIRPYAILMWGDTARQNDHPNDVVKLKSFLLASAAVGSLS